MLEEANIPVRSNEPEQVIDSLCGAISALRSQAPAAPYGTIGIGTGTIIGGELFKGAYGYSGEMGHMTIEANGRKCSCGNRGCWELYASEKAIAEAGKNVAYHSLQEIMQAAEQDEPIALHTLYQIGEYLGVGIANIINTFNPELVIIGNKLTQAERWIRKPLLRTVRQRTLQSHQHGLQIHFSSLQQHSTVLGAANEVIQSFVERTRVSV